MLTPYASTTYGVRCEDDKQADLKAKIDNLGEKLGVDIAVAVQYEDGHTMYITIPQVVSYAKALVALLQAEGYN
jgi:hypothetical protein